MKIHWRYWNRSLESWTILDTESDNFVKFTKESKFRNFEDDDIPFADPLLQAFHNLEFSDFKMARELIRMANYISQDDRYVIQYKRL